jgi:hypothetical protein
MLKVGEVFGLGDPAARCIPPNRKDISPVLIKKSAIDSFAGVCPHTIVLLVTASPCRTRHSWWWCNSLMTWVEGKATDSRYRSTREREKDSSIEASSLNCVSP